MPGLQGKDHQSDQCLHLKIVHGFEIFEKKKLCVLLRFWEECFFFALNCVRMKENNEENNGFGKLESGKL